MATFVAGGDEVAVGDERQHELGAGQRRGAQGQADVGTEPAAGDEDEAGAPLRVLVGELHGDAAAERVADDGRAVVAEDIEQVAQPAGGGAQRVVAGRRIGPSVTRAGRER